MGFWHWPGELGHVHAEELPSNNAQRGEAPVVEDGWTAQGQAAIDQLTTRIAELDDDAVVVSRHAHRHTFKGQDD